MNKKEIKKTLIFITVTIVPFALTALGGYYGIKYLTKHKREKKRERDLLHNKQRGNNGTDSGGTGSNGKT